MKFTGNILVMGCSLLIWLTYIFCRETTNQETQFGRRFGISTLFLNINHWFGLSTMIDYLLMKWGPDDIWLRIAPARDVEPRWNQQFTFLETAQNRKKSGTIGDQRSKFIIGPISLYGGGLKEIYLIMLRPWISTSHGAQYLQAYAGTCGLEGTTIFFGMMTHGSSVTARTFSYN